MYIFVSALLALKCPAVSEWTEVAPNVKNQFYVTVVQLKCLFQADKKLSFDRKTLCDKYNSAPFAPWGTAKAMFGLFCL